MIVRARKKSIPSIPTASMGDIAFLIIIFFMTSTVFTRDKGIKMLLPEKTAETDIVKINPENIVMILINPEGALKVKTPGYDENRVLAVGEYEEIRQIIEEKLVERDTLLVVSLRTSRETKYEHMVAVLDQIKLSQARTADGRELKANKISLIPASEE